MYCIILNGHWQCALTRSGSWLDHQAIILWLFDNIWQLGRENSVSCGDGNRKNIVRSISLWMVVHFLPLGVYTQPQHTGNQTVSVLKASPWFRDGVLYRDCRFHPRTINVQQILSGSKCAHSWWFHKFLRNLSVSLFLWPWLNLCVLF